jgi:hypothetical protein
MTQQHMTPDELDRQTEALKPRGRSRPEREEMGEVLMAAAKQVARTLRDQAALNCDADVDDLQSEIVLRVLSRPSRLDRCRGGGRPALGSYLWWVCLSIGTDIVRERAVIRAVHLDGAARPHRVSEQLVRRFEPLPAPHCMNTDANQTEYRGPATPP